MLRVYKYKVDKIEECLNPCGGLPGGTMVRSWLLSVTHANKFGPRSKPNKNSSFGFGAITIFLFAVVLGSAVPKNFVHDLVPKSQISVRRQNVSCSSYSTKAAEEEGHQWYTT